MSLVPSTKIPHYDTILTLLSPYHDPSAILKDIFLFGLRSKVGFKKCCPEYMFSEEQTFASIYLHDAGMTLR